MLKDIEVWNKLIAEFMGLKIESFPDKSDEWLVDISDHKSRYHNVPTQEMAFDSSWDWLMPVVEKIIYKDYDSEGDRLALHIQTTLSYAKITPAWESVIQFIQWYNQTQNK